ncbi:type IV toxin-antitoxin system AbiEi family antitoxin domain-containing protein [Pseudonocardia broussonetiae]|uniref:Type IV toxin-antitoxin system AbiEi family antitoxin domain-containing protein n=1 Tax=Pseudonocardia broussonetiae TaxID=2736640 RepID=A0A6M6JQG5_9PSEU|nr:type IV toxin-antitoxin system AbiEi family antitoxin domain-containing protein [Pseudonocardia broussonetiae]QJY50138.1 type IV toxin-antitoxin system AbiEi family antitoxin domain-containing protein [Pseudonocardia broussonetiae]
MSPESLLAPLLERQAGVVTLAQAVAAGVSASTVHRRVRARAWELLHPGVYLVGGHRYTDEVRIRAAWLWAGGAPAVVSGPAAAYWYRMLDRAPAVVELTVPRGRHLRPGPGMSVVRRDLSPADLVTDRHLDVTAEPLTALETALGVPDGSVFLDRALQRHVRFPALYRAYCRNVGRHGASRAAQLITASADRADSAAERLLVTLLRDAGITGWVLGHPFGAWRIDLAFPAEKLAIEVDGWAWHVDAERFRNDRRKGNAITRAGWDLLRYTWHALDGEPAETVAEIAGALATAA